VKKTLLVLAVLVAFCTSAFAVDETTWLKGQGGATFNYSQLQKSEFRAIANFEALQRVWGKNVFIGVQYRDINNAPVGSWEDYTGKAYVYTRDPIGSITLKKPQIYLMVGSGLAHQSNSDELGKFSFNGGCGILIPTGLANFIVELNGANIDKDWIVTVTAGIQVGIDFKQ
jgi:hypothetical protein